MSDHRSDERVVVSGTANLAHYGDFDTAVRPLLEALEEHVVLLKLLGEAGRRHLTVRIGPRAPRARGHHRRGHRLRPRRGVPLARWACSARPGWTTRIDGSVRAVARYVSQILDEG